MADKGYNAAQVRTMRQARLDAANELIREIASCGRRFFSLKADRQSAPHERISHFHVDRRGRIWFVDKYTERRIYTHYRGDWRGFTEGGTLRDLVENLRDFIRVGKHIPRGTFGPWPKWICDGDLWAYGDDMQIVRDAAARLGVTAPAQGEKV